MRFSCRLIRAFVPATALAFWEKKQNLSRATNGPGVKLVFFTVKTTPCGNTTVERGQILQADYESSITVVL